MKIPITTITATATAANAVYEEECNHSNNTDSTRCKNEHNEGPPDLEDREASDSNDDEYENDVDDETASMAYLDALARVRQSSAWEATDWETNHSNNTNNRIPFAENSIKKVNNTNTNNNAMKQNNCSETSLLESFSGGGGSNSFTTHTEEPTEHHQTQQVPDDDLELNSSSSSSSASKQCDTTNLVRQTSPVSVAARAVFDSHAVWAFSFGAADFSGPVSSGPFPSLKSTTTTAPPFSEQSSTLAIQTGPWHDGLGSSNPEETACRLAAPVSMWLAAAEASSLPAILETNEEDECDDDESDDETVPEMDAPPLQSLDGSMANPYYQSKKDEFGNLGPGTCSTSLLLLVDPDLSTIVEEEVEEWARHDNATCNSQPDSSNNGPTTTSHDGAFRIILDPTSIATGTKARSHSQSRTDDPDESDTDSGRLCFWCALFAPKQSVLV